MHKGMALGLCLVAAWSAAVAAEVTPMDAPLKDDQWNEIKVEFKGPEKINFWPFVATKGEYSYSVYIPKGYSTEKDRKYPCFFIAGGGLGQLEKRLKQEKWLIVNVQFVNGDLWSGVIGMWLPIHDDAAKRLRILEGLKVSSGFSGGSRAASRYACTRPGFMGVILCGAAFGQDDHARYVVDGLKPHIGIYGLFGDKDGNKDEIGRLRKQTNVRIEVEEFIGTHELGDENCFNRAMDWLERGLFAEKRVMAAAKDIVVPYFDLKVEALDEMTGLRKHDTILLLKDVIATHGLASKAELKDKVAKVNDLVAADAKDDKMKQEVDARTMYLKARSHEAQLRAQVKNWDDKKIPPKLTEDASKTYKAVADKYKDTEYGQFAAKQSEGTGK